MVFNHINMTDVVSTLTETTYLVAIAFYNQKVTAIVTSG